MAGFLQSVAPFLQAPDLQRSLVGLFSGVLNGEIGDLSGESLFDLSELRLISEFHTDVFTTPAEQLVPAFDFVKSAVLGGTPYHRGDHPKVALELKKFLTSSTEEKQKSLQAEALRQANLAREEHARRELAEREAAEGRARIARLEERVAEVTREMGTLREGRAAEGRREVTRLKAEAERAESKNRRREARLSAALAVIGAVLASALWALDAELTGIVTDLMDLTGDAGPSSRLAIRLLGAVGLVGCFLPAVRRLVSGYRLPALTVVVASAAGGLDIVGPDVVATVSGAMAIGAPVALALLIVLQWRRVIDTGGGET